MVPKRLFETPGTSRGKTSCGRLTIYNGFPPMNSDHRRTSDGMPSLRGSFSLMHWAKRMAVCNTLRQSHHMAYETEQGGGGRRERGLTWGSMKSGTLKSTALRRMT